MRGIVLLLGGALVGAAGCGVPRRQAGATAPPASRPVVPGPSARVGPTIRLEAALEAGNPIAAFMYFVPLISPELVSLTASAGNTQRARVIALTRRRDGQTFSARCDFAIVGDGWHRHTFDFAAVIRQQAKKLAEGGSVGRRLHYIHFGGEGSGAVEVQGRVAEGGDVVTDVVLRFRTRGGRSPVIVSICDIRRENGEIKICNEIVAGVRALTFRRTADRPRMGVTLCSVSKGGAADTWWEQAKGMVAGAVANAVIKPIGVEAVGNQAMLDFGHALFAEQPTFTFPKARNLKSGPPTQP